VSPDVAIVDLDRDGLARMALEGPWCLRCPLCERHAGRAGTGECSTSPADIERIVRDGRSGVKLALQGGRIVGYAVFGRPALFPGVGRQRLEVDEDSLFIGALYATPAAREQNVHADLLIAVMNSARGHGYDTVTAACRGDESEEPEARVDLLVAGGFELDEADRGLGTGTVALQEWDRPEAGEARQDDGALGQH